MSKVIVCEEVAYEMTTYKFIDEHGRVFFEELGSDDAARLHAKSVFPALADGVSIERQKWVRIEFYDVQREV